jgi:protein-disulfide isomerase
MRNILIAAGGLVAVAVIAAGVYYGTRPASPGPAPVPAAATMASPDKAAILSVQPNDHVEGDPNAPITLIEYASFTCPHCAEFNTVELPQIKTQWIDTGKVKLVYRDFPLDETAAKVAQLANCAGKDKYFAVVDMIFRGQGTWATAADPIAELSKSLRIAGMGDNEVKACLANTAGADAVVASYRSGETVGVNSTPTLFINGEQFRGSRSVEELGATFSKLLPSK